MSRVYFTLSQGGDPTRWRSLNGGRPVLTTSVGTRGARDRFIVRTPQGDKFYQIATDLFIDEYGGQGYLPFTTTDLSSGQWAPVSSYSMPGRPRHGTVLPVTQAEYDRLLQRWG